MVIISHRGNIDGPDPETENTPTQINLAIRSGFDVEVDVRFEGGVWKLGHDFGQYSTTEDWLRTRQERLWLHCKDREAVVECRRRGFHHFIHDLDMATMTSMGYLWCYPGECITGGVYVMPELGDDDVRDACGVCTDLPTSYR